MAPALTEPLSSKEKLSSSAATASPTTASTTRASSRKHESTSIASASDAASTTTTTTVASATTTTLVTRKSVSTPTLTTNNNTVKDKNTINSTSSAAITTTTAATTSSRVTRSKDTQNQQKNNAGGGTGAKFSPVASRRNNNNNNKQRENYEQMGLSAARSSSHNSTTSTTNNNSSNSVSSSNSNSSSISDQDTDAKKTSTDELIGDTATVVDDKVTTVPNCKDNSTEQLLADLTNDFEEAITAEICLRNKLPEVTLSKEAASETVGVSGEGLSGDGVDAAVAVTPTAADVQVLKHMESKLLETTATTDTAPSAATETTKETTAAQSEKNDDPMSKEDGKTHKEGKQQSEQPDSPVSAVSVAATATATTTAASSTQITIQPPIEQPTCSTRAHMPEVDELPSGSTDSTITPSDVVYNLEARLSQLDGNGAAPLPSSMVGEYRVATAISEILSTAKTPTTPTRNSALQQQKQEQQHSPASLTQTPPTPITAALQQQLATLTPQSINSAVSSVSLPQGFLKENATGDELGDQDIEEVLKALKGFEGVANADIDLNVFFGDVFQNVGNNYNNFEDVNSQNAATSAASNSVSAIGGSNHNLSNSETKVSPMKDAYADIKNKQELLTHRMETLLRRMRKLQARHMCKHTSVEIAGLFEWSARMTAKTHHPVRNAALSEQELSAMAVVSGRPPIDFWQAQKRNPLASAQMSSMLKRLQTVASEQQLCTTPPVNSIYGSSTYMQQPPIRRPRKQQQQEAAATSRTSTANATEASASQVSSERKAHEVVPNYDSYAASELTHVSGLLHTEMREVQNAIDSDATESSSGGESADEMVTYNNKLQQPLSIAKRAVWRYSRDRAAIALRWSWLLTQAKDLDVKIRQHNELYTELNRTRGEVLLEPVKQTSVKSTQQESVNGYKSTSGNNSHNYNNNASDSESEAEPSCSRTRALVLTAFRKRKLFQTTNMHTISKKTARPSNIKCGCQWPRQPCALCTGRADPTAPRALPDTMMPSNRVALLDPGYHPVLSFPEDVCRSIHFETISRQPAWQYRVMRCQAKAIVKGVWKAEREAVAALGGSGTGRRHGAGGAAGDQPVTKRRYIRRKDRNVDGVGDNNKTTAAKGTTATPAASASATTAAAAASSAGGVVTNESGNGTASTSTTTPTTPLVANILVNKRQRRIRKNLAQSVQNEHQQILPRNEQYNSNNNKHNNSQVHATSISSSIKNRKTSMSTATATAATSNSNLNSTHNQYNPQQATSQFNVNCGENNSFLGQNPQEQGNPSSDHHQLNEVSTQRSRTSSPTHGGSKSGHPRHYERSNRNRVSYDIDNIVIPYSIAAATRVEILPYKEIPTPKWRVLGCEAENEEPQQMTEQHCNEVEVDALNAVGKLNGDATEAQAAEAAKDTIVLNNATKLVNPAKANGALAQNNKSLSVADTPAKNEAAAHGDTKRNDQQLVVKIRRNNAAIKVAEAIALPPPSKHNHNNATASLTNGKAAKDDHLALRDKEVTTLEIDMRAPAKKNNNNNLLKLNNINANKVKKNSDDSSVKLDQEEIKKKVESSSGNDDDNKGKLLLPPEPLAKKRRVENGKTVSQEDNGDDAAVAAADKPKSGEVPEATNISKAPPTLNTKLLVAKFEPKPPLDDVSAVDEEGDLEDISEDAFKLRHDHALVEERRKFITFLKFPLCTRSRANRRVDSRAESSGANTPDPASPAPQTASIGGGDNESIPSPLAQAFPNPLDTLHEANETNVMAQPTSSSRWYNHSKRQERRRTTSFKNKELCERRSASPEFVQPYEPRNFPLAEDEVDKMTVELNEAYKRKYVVYKFNEDDMIAGYHSASRRYHASKSTSSSVYSNDGGGNGKRRNYSKYRNATQRKGGTHRANGGKIHDTADDDEDDAIAAASGGYGSIGYEDDDGEDLIRPEDILNAVDDDDDDYPKHHLAPNDDMNSYYDEGADAHSTLLGNDSETDDANDPFMDDDPNDPEWRRGLGVRTEPRVRRKL